MILFSDGFDGHVALTDKWVSVDAGSVILADAGKFGVGTGALSLTGRMRATFDLPATNPRGSLLNPIHSAFYMQVAEGSSSLTQPILEFTDLTQNRGFALIITSSMTLGLTKWIDGPDDDDPIAIAGGQVSVGMMHHVEFKYSAHATAGVVKLWLNRVPVIDFVGNTLEPGTTLPTVDGISRVKISQPSPTSLNAIYDDLLIWDEEGPSMNDVDQSDAQHRIETLTPISDGSSTQFTAVGAGTTNADRILEGPADGDTTYVESSVTANIDLYNCSDLQGTPVKIHGVSLQSRLTNSDAGTVSARARVKQNLVDGIGATNQLSAGGVYTQHAEFFAVNPDGDVEWTVATINAAEFGIEAII